ncbi:MAG: hypothetical protein ABIS35_14990 [Terracoccus sp.]
MSAEHVAGRTGTDAAEGGATDGRVARRHVTRQRIVEAHAALLREGDLQPTAAVVAARAGVSVRALWTNFKDVEGLRAATTDYWIGADEELVEPVDPSASLDERIDRFCAQRQLRLERLAPAVRSSMIALHRSPELVRSRQLHITRLRHELERLFARELGAAPDRDELLRSLMLAASWTSWLLLRDDLGADVEGAGATIRRTLHALLTERPAPTAR